jgi:hypothetical protein
MRQCSKRSDIAFEINIGIPIKNMADKKICGKNRENILTVRGPD